MNFADRLTEKYEIIRYETVEKCNCKVKTGYVTNNKSDWLLFYPYDEFFP